MSESKPRRQRLDAVLVERQLVESRAKAQAMVLAGKVTVDGLRADKPGHSVSNEARIQVEEGLKYVSRGGLKLEAALEGFGIDPAGRVCLDIGTSTGGFADCLLQKGAARVHCVDTGAGQIHWKLRTDARIVLHENVNARYLTPEAIGEPASLIVCDVSFISVALLIPSLTPLLTPEGEMVVLVKPQFEAGREFVGRGGIVRDEAGHKLACTRVAEALHAEGFMTRLMDSPILGAKGNREFLLHATRRAS